MRNLAGAEEEGRYYLEEIRKATEYVLTPSVASFTFVDISRP